MTGEEIPPITEALFDLTVNLCDRFHSLNPVSIRHMPAREVFWMIQNIIQKSEREERQKLRKQVGLKDGDEVIHKNGKTIIRRKATTWV